MKKWFWETRKVIGVDDFGTGQSAIATTGVAFCIAIGLFYLTKNETKIYLKHISSVYLPAPPNITKKTRKTIEDIISEIINTETSVIFEHVVFAGGLNSNDNKAIEARLLSMMGNLTIKLTRNGVTSIMLRDFLDAIKFIEVNMNIWPSLYLSGVERCVSGVSLLCCKQYEEDRIYIAHYAVYNSSVVIEADRCVMQLSKLDPFTRH
ncbi:unnamed protein product [Didymodactylos carnosus]|uniref:Uncharacterized protein n=1 Tax=Didymodactylos carnosus TaxID=1234261 RepID=A0A814CIY2_9BILA|nr:unnamed protein product [Didymodactylos carnosus]CAF3719142.1 unnamed protein product [Didymodactylos carnosus]